MLRRLAFTSLFVLGGCFGSCGPGGGLRESTKASCASEAAPAGGFGIELGDDEAGKAFESLAGKTLHLDYGSQGGMHFYFSLRIYGFQKDSLVFVRFLPKASSAATSAATTTSGTGASSAGGGGAGGAGGAGGGGAGGAGTGGAGGAGTGGAGGGASGPIACKGYDDAPDCFESGTLFLSEELKLPTCGSGEWLEIHNEIFQMSHSGPREGTLVAELGTCPAEGCPVGPGGDHELAVVQAHAEVDLRYVP